MESGVSPALSFGRKTADGGGDLIYARGRHARDHAGRRSGA